MRRLRIACVIAFIASLALLGVSYIKGRASRDTVGPVIEVSGNLLEASVKDTEEALLKGIKATDAVDGDVTDKVYVESIGPFDENMHRTVTYIAFDAHNNVTRAQRELVYTDYTSPKFVFDKPFSFDTDSYNLLIWTTTDDCLDGVRSGNVFIRTDKEIDVSMPGEYSVVLETTNSAGDTASLPVTIEIYKASEHDSLPQIKLKENVVYLEKGAKWDARQYLDTITIEDSQYTLTDQTGTYGTEQEASVDQNMTIGYSSVKIQDSVNTAVPGSYEVVYTFEDTSTNTGTGTARLYVVVTERGN